MEDPRLAEYYAVPIGIRNIAKLSFQSESAYNKNLWLERNGRKER